MSNVKKPSLLDLAMDLTQAVSDVRKSKSWDALQQSLPHGDGHTVIVLPGFMTSDRATAVLRERLIALDYDARPWKLGLNFGETKQQDVLEQLSDQIKRAYIESSRPVSLVGWSLGGLLAKEAARIQPDLVRQVITLGSPIAGFPQHASIWKLYEIITNVLNRKSPHVAQPQEFLKNVPDVHVTSIFAKSDAIVPPHIARQEESEHTENIMVAASHFSMTLSPGIFEIIADRLAQPEDDWKPYKLSAAS